MTYIVFARKWRPKTFDEIIGQGHVARILKNAIKQGRVAHAYIFSGPRGVGKTSAARIFAKALNCQKGPAPDPCNKCASCVEISGSRSLDVLEIDGASNRGIDEIRSLRENVKFAPVQGKFKIYIIDEVHQITTDGFNALLKTLEEPPAHVKFIFATTQPNKVLPTILSRCQRFDFRRIPTKDIVAKLALVSKQEKLQITDDALYAIARSADGSMRDAESVLDQMSSFAGKKIEIAGVNQVLGTLNEETLFEMSEAIAGKDTPGILKMIDGLVKEGKDISFVSVELLAHFRNLLIAKVGKDLKELIDLSKESVKKLYEKSGRFTVEDLLYALNVLSAAHSMMRRSNITRVPLEMALVKLTRKESITSIGDILERISFLEEKIDGSGSIEESVREEPAIEPDRSSGPEEKPAKAQPDDPKTNEEDNGGSGGTDDGAVKDEEINTKEGLALRQITHAWPNVLKNIRIKKISIASCLSEGEPISFKDNAVTLGFPKGHSFHREVIEKVSNKKLVEEALSKILTRDITLEFTTTAERRNSNNNMDLQDNYPEEDILSDELNQDLSPHKDDPIVDSALDIFKGRIVGDKRHRV